LDDAGNGAATRNEAKLSHNRLGASVWFLGRAGTLVPLVQSDALKQCIEIAREAGFLGDRLTIIWVAPFKRMCSLVADSETSRGALGEHSYYMHTYALNSGGIACDRRTNKELGP
jgi:hypothetical protein